MSMRLAEGMDMARYQAHGANLPRDRIADLLGLGLVTKGDGRLAATATGRPVLNAILRELAD